MSPTVGLNMLAFSTYRKPYFECQHAFSTDIKNLEDNSAHNRKIRISLGLVEDIKWNIKFYVLLTVHFDNLSNENQLGALFILNLFRQ
jgi:hypothetical protein